MWDPQRLTTLWAFTACYRDSFTFTLYNLNDSNLPTFGGTYRFHLQSRSVNPAREEQANIKQNAYLAARSTYSSALKMEAVLSFKISVNVCQTTRRHIQKMPYFFIVTAVRTSNPIRMCRSREYEEAMFHETNYFEFPNKYLSSLSSVF
jgi:hypothetical protein